VQQNMLHFRDIILELKYTRNRSVKMYGNELAQTTQKYLEQNIEITDIKMGLRCKDCGHTWGIKVSLDIDMMSQTPKFICTVCHQKRLVAWNEGTNYYGYDKEISQK
jgi:Zn finger protein HypA/HybF involved in hydrogenase expression